MEKEVSRLYRCGVCGMMSNDINSLRNHMIAEHVNGQEEGGETAGEMDSTQAGTEAMEVGTEGSEAVHDGDMLHYGQTDQQIPTEETSSAQMTAFSNLSEPGKEDVPPQEDNDVELKFKVKIPTNAMTMFPKHIKPLLYFTCTYCDFQHRSFKEISLHIFDKHPKKLPYKQRNLDKEEATQEVAVVDNSAYLTTKKMRRQKPLMLKSTDSEKSPEGNERGTRKFSCIKCNMKTDSDKILEIHKQCHSEGTDKLMCCFCGKEAPRVKAWYGLFIHMVNKHPEEVPAPLFCEICKKGFVKEFDLQRHMSTHSFMKPYPCELCGHAFKYCRNLKEHQLLRHKIGSAEDRQRLMEKIKTKKKVVVDDDLPWIQCAECGYKTKSNTKFSIHLKIHTGVKDIACNYCDFRTGDRSSLKRHMWRHRVEKPYSCKFCEFECIQRPQIIAHYKNKHSLPATSAKKLIQHINGSRRYEDDLDEDDHMELMQSNHNQAINVVITENTHINQDMSRIESHGGGVAHMQSHEGHIQVDHHLQDVHQIQDVHHDNPVDLDLLTEAAEGLLAASQIELHTTG